MNEPALVALAERVDRLARGNARLRRWSVLSVIALVGVLAWVASGVLGSEVRSSVVRAERIVLQDPSGQLRATLTAGTDESSILFYGKDGRPRAKLAVSAESPELMLFDANGNVRADLRLEADGSPSLILTERDGTVRAALGVGREGVPIFVLRRK
ncbi:MAG: hypothetical protein HY002_00615 [Candidatus Rokubacteria bacterium]|nr:hypothetical protein [Candidatus Rokubacteria bacterium]